MKPGGSIAERYAPALLLLVVALVYSIAVPDGEWQRILSMALQSIALYATLAAAEVDRRILKAYGIFFIVALVGVIAQAGFIDGDGPGLVRICIFAIVLSALPLVGFGLVRQVRSGRKISVQTMMGVLCAYLLLMTLFAYTYAVVGEFGSEPFFNQGAQWNSPGDYIYYSTITTTTVGLGDLTPASDLGRSLTAAEALIGQIYVVTVVALIVSNLGRSEPRPSRSDDESSGNEQSGGVSSGG